MGLISGTLTTEEQGVRGTVRLGSVETFSFVLISFNDAERRCILQN